MPALSATSVTKRFGDVVAVDPQPVLDQLAAGRIPVVSSSAPDPTIALALLLSMM